MDKGVELKDQITADAVAGVVGNRPVYTKPEDRKCRDLLFLILFAVFWVGMLAIGGVGIALGEPARLMYGADYQGNLCGTGARSAKRQIVYPRFGEDILLAVQRGFSLQNPLDKLHLLTFFGVCMETCPKEGDWVCSYEADALVTNPTMDGANRDDRIERCFTRTSANATQCSTVRDNCWVTPISTRSLLFRCLPVYERSVNTTLECVFPQNVTDPNSEDCLTVVERETRSVRKPASENFVFDKMNQANAIWSRWFGDLVRSWYVVLVCGLVLSTVLAFSVIFFMKWCAGVLVWTTLFLMLVGMICMTIYCYFKAGMLSASSFTNIPFMSNNATATMFKSYVDDEFPANLDVSEQNQKKFRWAAYVFTVLTVLAIIFLIAMRSRIRVAVAIIKATGDCLKQMPLIVLYPFVSLGMLSLLLAYWFAVSMLLASAGTITTQDLSEAAARLHNTSSIFEVKEMDEKPVGKYLILYNTFGLLWTNQFIQAIGICTIAGAVAQWYQTSGDAASERPKSPVFTAFKVALKYHAGSLAMGSFFIAVIEMLRLMMDYLDRQLKDKMPENYLVKMLMKCIKCFLWCFEKCVKYITKTAYIMIAMQGDNFCSSAISAFKLLRDNLAQIAVLNAVSVFILLLSKIFVSCTCGFIAFLMLDNSSQFKQTGSQPLSSVWLPVLVVMLAAYFVTTAFAYVYDIAIDAMLMCCCQDLKQNEHTGNYAMRESLAKAFGVASKQRAAKALEAAVEREEKGRV